MLDQWDVDVNIDSLSPEERLQEDNRRLMESRRRQEEERQRHQQARGYFDPPSIPERVIRSEFPHYRDTTNSPYNWEPWLWTAGRTVWICHNCGTFGYKYALHELFKCYSCRSRNVTVCRSGELSLAIRNNRNIGVHMEEVFQSRQERMAEARRIRRENSNSRRQREQN